jgi:hypothetical protein
MKMIPEGVEDTSVNANLDIVWVVKGIGRTEQAFQLPY